MSKQDIADFEAGLNKLCEFYRRKLTHAELVGTLDTVKMGYHIETIRQFVEPEIEAPMKAEEIICGNCRSSNNCKKSRITKDLLAIGFEGCGFAPKEKAGSPVPAEVVDG